ncbi:hypothetical protein BN946_scf184753.g47, partial [Trametes cinnabarina]
MEILSTTALELLLAPVLYTECRLRENMEMFEDIPDDKSSLQCVICSMEHQAPVTLKKTSLGRHIKSGKHQKALTNAHHDGDQVNVQGRADTPSSLAPATLTLHLFDEDELDLDGQAGPAAVEHNPFADVFNDGGAYVNADGDEIHFSAGDEAPRQTVKEITAELQRIERNGSIDFARTVSDLDQFERTLEADTTVPDAILALETMGLGPDAEVDEDEDDEIAQLFNTSKQADNAWWPYPNQTWFMVDMMDHLPRKPISDDQMKVFLWVLQESKGVNVPTFTALRKFQTHAARQIGFRTTHHITALNNEYFANKPAELFRLNLANPLVRPQMRLYPEICGPVSEFFHSKKLLAMDDQTLDHGQLMWADWKHAPQRHFYIKEIALLQDGRFVIPLRFVTVRGIESFDGLELAYHSASPPAWVADMPHPVRKIACGRPAITMQLMPWSDDVSGNRTKQYNAHTNIYIANANLPHAKLQQEYFIHFVSTSQYASSSEQMRVIADDTGPNRWHTGYDCLLEQEVMYRIIPHVLPADNPQQAEHCSHITGKGNHPCRRCEVGGTAAECEQDQIYEQFFSGGTQRTVDTTICHIREQLRTACLGVQDAVDSLQTKTGVKDKIAQHWINILVPMARERQQLRLYDAQHKDARLRDMHLRQDERRVVHKDIKKEIQSELFTWLISQPEHTYAMLPPLSRVDKYAWHKTNTEWDKKNEELFSVRLRASSIDGLTLTSVLGDYITRYPNSLLGKHFKIIQQLAVFQLYDGVCPPLVFDLWKATGELGAMLWFHKIRDMETYIDDLRVLIANLLDIWAIIDPMRIIVKQKLHVLSHILEDIRRHGPALLYSTEIFECWNTIFRHCSIHSNHHAASHDIARTLADTERFKHQVSGGWWPLCKEDADSESTANRLQRRLGWVDPGLVVPGSVRLLSVNKRNPSAWSVARGEREVPLPVAQPIPYGDSDIWLQSKLSIAQSEDVCRAGSWVFYRNQSTSAICAGRIYAILTHLLTGNSTVIIDCFHVNLDRDSYFNMPVLYRPEAAPVSSTVDPTDILFSFNAQHHCRSAGCTEYFEQTVFQERQATSITRKDLVHKSDQLFLINMHALHNAARVREVLPRELTRPIPYVADRIAKHQEISAALRIAGPIKRAQARAKAAETRARNKESKGKGAVIRHREIPEPEYPCPS